MVDWQKVVYCLLNSAIFNLLEWPLTQISRTRYHSTLNVSETVHSDVNKDFTFKAKDKDQPFKAKDKDKNETFKAKDED